MIRFVILAVVAYVFYRALKSWMSGGERSEDGRRRTTGGEVDDVLIQDPVCLTYFAQRNGVHLHHQGRDLYFCSNQCRERYLLDQAPPNDRAEGS
jgi:YHS domain-containing protein